MHLKKSFKLLIAALVLITTLIIITKIIHSQDKWLYHRISTLNNMNEMVEKSIADLDGQWYYKNEDNSNFAAINYNNSKWKPTRYLYMPLLQSAKGKTWFRKSFNTPKKIATDSLILRLSLFDIQAQVYINGTLIADSCILINNSVCCKFTTKLLKSGSKNIIAVRSQSMVANKNITKTKDELIYVVSPNFSLEGIWKFKTGDNFEWIKYNYNDMNFTNLIVPKRWDDQGYKEYDGMAWYRKKFSCPKEYNTKKLVFMAGSIDDYNEVFINGKKIGGEIIFKSVRDLTLSAWSTPLFYVFDGSLLNDTNIIAVRVLDNQLSGGIYRGPVGIMPMDDYLKFIDSK
jgi:hypothetical protein